MISRPLWATYIVTPEQKSSGILISELFEVRKWVVEKFHGISPGLDCTSPSTSLCERLYEPFLLKLRAAVGAFDDGEGSAALLAQLLALTQLLERDPAKALGAG